MTRRPPRSTQSRSSAASDVYKRQLIARVHARPSTCGGPPSCARWVFLASIIPRSVSCQSFGFDERRAGNMPRCDQPPGDGAPAENSAPEASSGSSAFFKPIVTVSFNQHNISRTPERSHVLR
eukprot:TRINITY_DN3590_c0_g1_i1.p1 TRINITY_DN3590_c0_g1~~TRINITY_DN3590_c0_g1_i1.p1  ORF type:complete len:123 (+),score=20.62 TRINITY_DN3590_c0_g1_i1:60-428(+)